MIYAFTCDSCGSSVEVSRSVDARNDPLACKCGQPMRRDLRAELGTRSGELPDWISDNAGPIPSPGEIAKFNRTFAHLGVKADDKGRAHVPGNVRRRFLRERGLVEL